MADDIIELIVKLFLHIMNTEPERVSRVIDALPGANATRAALKQRFPGIDLP